MLAGIGPDLYRENAFRITGLRYGASARQIAKKIADLGVRADLGDLPDALPKAFGLKPAPTIDTIRDAEKRLRDPETRLVDELFWFWPLDPANDGSDAALADGNTAVSERLWRAVESSPTLGSAATHNLAVRWHLTALDLERELDLSPGHQKNRETLAKCWNSCLRRWKRLATDEGFWSHVSALIRKLDDPRIRLSRVQSLRAALPDAIALINVRLAIRYAELGGRGYQLLLHTSLYLDSNSAPVTDNRFRELVATELRNKFRPRIAVAHQRIETSPQTANEIAGELLPLARLYVELVDIITDPDAPQQNTSVDDLVEVVVTAAVAYQTTTAKNAAAIEILRQCEALARGKKLCVKVASNLQIGLSNLAWEKVEPLLRLLEELQKLTAISQYKFKEFQREITAKANALQSDLANVPDVRTELNNRLGWFLRELSVAAWNNDRDAKTAEAARLLAAHFAEEPALIARLKEDGQTLASLVKGQKTARLKKALRWGAATGGLVVILALIGVFNSPENSAPPSPTANMTAAPPASPSPPPGPVPVDTPGTDPKPAADDATFGKNTYLGPEQYASEPRADEQAIRHQQATERALSGKLQSLGERIDRERAAVDDIARRVQSMKTELTVAQPSVDQTDPVAVSSYNRRVAAYQAELQRGRAQDANLNRLIRRYKGLLERDRHEVQVIHTAIDQYNDKLQRLGRPE